MNTLFGIASSLGTTAGHEEATPDFNPEDDPLVGQWLLRIHRQNMQQQRRKPLHGHTHRRKVWFVPCERSDSGEDVSMTRMVGLLQKFGTGPALPTAMFPCDKSSTSSAIAEMAWRLKRASSMLDQGGDDLDSRLASLFLCSGMIVVTRPDTLR